jgi:hypothetical protein
MKVKIINIDDEKWKITLNTENELLFSYLVPYDRTIYATNPLWHSWDTDVDDENEFENYVESVGVSSINIFKIKSVLLKEIVNLIKQTGIEFFYFCANTDKKTNVYKRISKDLISMLNGEWDVQFIDEWFYFYKSK